MGGHLDRNHPRGSRHQDLLNATLAKADLALAILITDEQGNVLASAPPVTASNAFAALKIFTKFSSAGGP